MMNESPLLPALVVIRVPKGRDPCAGEPCDICAYTVTVEELRPRGGHYGLRLASDQFGELMISLWVKSVFGAARLCQEMHEVVGLRLIKLSRGDAAARREAQRMLTEKATACAEAGFSVASGASIEKVARRYRSYIRANRRRLSR